MLKKEVHDNLRLLCKEYGGNVEFDYPLSGNSWIAIGGRASAWYVPSSLEELVEAKKLLDSSGTRIIVMGNGSNILIPDKGLDAAVINLSSDFFKKVIIQDKTVTAGGGTDLRSLISHCYECGLTGLEGLAGIPATVGGALKLNASYKIEINEPLLRVRVLDSEGKDRWMDKKDLKFGYRSSSFKKNDIILQAAFFLEKMAPVEARKIFRAFLAEKMEKQPLDKKSLGCVFRNPEQNSRTSGELIEKAGLKGLRCGGAKVSEKHANFIINEGEASFEDVISLMDEVKSGVLDKFSIELKPEIEVLNNNEKRH